MCFRRVSLFCLQITAASLAILLLFLPRLGFASQIFINEIHYDNLGGDLGEAIEVAGPTGMDLAGWKLVLYNGNNGSTYATLNLDGLFSDQKGGMGTLVFDTVLQNGAPDGVALVNADQAPVQFLSYEGVLTAINGPAAGMTSTDIGVFEQLDTSVGFSLQLIGPGRLSQDFVWSEPRQNSFGAVNTGQSFVPVPAALPLFLSALSAAWLTFGRSRRHR